MIIFHILTYLIYILLQMTIWGTSDTLNTAGFAEGNHQCWCQDQIYWAVCSTNRFFLVIFLLSRIFWEKYINTDEGEIRLREAILKKNARKSTRRCASTLVKLDRPDRPDRHLKIWTYKYETVKYWLCEL